MSDEQINTTEKTSIIHTVAYTILVALLAVSSYFNYESTLSSGTSECEPLKKSYAELQTNFNEALARIQSFEDAKKMAQSLKAEMQMEDKGDMEPVQEAKAPEEAIEVLEEEIPPLPRTQTASKATKVKDFAKCYDMQQGIYEVSKKCRKEIQSYVDRHPDAKYFEIIGIVDRFEFKLFSQFDKDNSFYEGLGTTKKAVDKIRKYTQFGLAKYRASEASWVIKTHTKHKAHTYNANYHLVSKKDYKGVVVRAYK